MKATLEDIADLLLSKQPSTSKSYLTSLSYLDLLPWTKHLLKTHLQVCAAEYTADASQQYRALPASMHRLPLETSSSRQSTAVQSVPNWIGQDTR